MESPYSTLSLTKLPSTQMNPLPNLTDPNLTEFLKPLFPAIDHKKLHSTENIQILRFLMENFSDNSSNEVFKNLKTLMGYNICMICNIPIDIKHTCEAILCPSCVKKADYCCPNCRELLEANFLYALFGITGKCSKCRLDAETECRHFCFRCLMLTPFEELHCQECQDASDYFFKNIVKCFNCGESFNFKEDFMAYLCTDHHCCTHCSKKAIENSRCYCGKVIPVAKIYAIYKYIHAECFNCKEDYLRTNPILRECCKNPVCPTCANLNCSLCINPTLIFDI